jgi:hypothetical protein
VVARVAARRPPAPGGRGVPVDQLDQLVAGRRCARPAPRSREADAAVAAREHGRILATRARLANRPAGRQRPARR